MSIPKLRERREKRGLSLRAMAKLCKCSPSFLSRLENGISGETMNRELADRVGAGYGCTIRLGAKRVVR
jgi:transcriptional regulator with XRE-family HTH domain